MAQNYAHFSFGIKYFLISLLVSDFEKSVWSVPSIPVAVLDLGSVAFNHEITKVFKIVTR